MIKVLIADDHTIVRDGLRRLVDAESDMAIAGEAQNGNEVLEIVRQTSVDVVLLDISMPGRNGLETLKELKKLHPLMPVIVLSMHPKDQYAVRVLRAGASGYITKESAPEELILAIRKAFAGEKFISPDVAELLADYIERGETGEPHRVLSDREFEVFRKIAQGKTVTQISKELFLSVKTVSTYRTRVVEKTGLTTNAAIVQYARDHKIV
ncbi:MAG: response regulator transcription factor [Acidobacteriota bacterium]